jgi:hypothetical protein
MKNLILVIFFSSLAMAAKKPECKFELACEIGQQKFSLEFKSPSGDCAEDDMILNFKTVGAIEKLNLHPEWYFFTEHISKTQSSVCKEAPNGNAFAAYPAEGKYVLLFMKASGRPGYDRVIGVLIDPSTRKVLGSVDIGQSRNQYIAVLKTEKGYKVRVVRDSLSFHKDVTCDCDAPFVDDWKQVQVQDGRIVVDWLNP